MFRKISNGIEIYIVIFVDDFMISSPSQDEINKTIKLIKDKYIELTINTGDTHTYLGMYFDFSSPGKVNITMKNYIEKLLQEYKITKGINNPINTADNKKNHKLLNQNRQKFIHSGTAKLLYLSTRVRPDILYPVNKLCSSVNKYNKNDEILFYKILQYLYNTKDQGITLQCEPENTTLEAFVDASYATSNDRKSHSGTMIRFGSGPIVCKSNKQSIVAKSSTEAELIACADSISYIYSIKHILEFLGNEIKDTIVYQDNQSTIKLLTNNKATNQRSKHIDVKYFFLRDKVKEDVKLQYCPTDKMLADMLTKQLSNPQFKILKDAMMNIQD